MKHETQRDRIAEDAISKIWMDHMHRRGHRLTQKKIPNGPRYSFDFAYVNPSTGLVCVIAEVKDRPGWRKCYDTVLLGASKVKQLVEYNEGGLPAYFIVRLDGEVRYLRMSKRVLKSDVKWRGRTDRGGSRDEEPCYMLPLGKFATCRLSPKQ